MSDRYLLTTGLAEVSGSFESDEAAWNELSRELWEEYGKPKVEMDPDVDEADPYDERSRIVATLYRFDEIRAMHGRDPSDRDHGTAERRVAVALGYVGREWEPPADEVAADGGRPSGECEVCGGEIEGFGRLTSDSHPEGPNLIVCDDCSEVDVATDGGRPDEGVRISWNPGEGIQPEFTPANEFVGAVITREAYIRLALEATISMYPRLVEAAAEAGDGHGPASTDEIAEMMNSLAETYGIREESYVDLDLDRLDLDPSTDES